MDILECPICLTLMTPPTTRCYNGHSVCAKCSQTITSCPECRADLEKGKNVTVDKILKTFFHPCKGKAKGCTTVLPFGKLGKHEESCEYLKMMTCIISGCEEDMTCNLYHDHLLSKHERHIKLHTFPVIARWKFQRCESLYKLSFIKEQSCNALFEYRFKINYPRDIMFAVAFVGPKFYRKMFYVETRLVAGDDEMSKTSFPLPYGLTENEIWSKPTLNCTIDRFQSDKFVLSAVLNNIST